MNINLLFSKFILILIIILVFLYIVYFFRKKKINKTETDGDIFSMYPYIKISKEDIIYKNEEFTKTININFEEILNNLDISKKYQTVYIKNKKYQVFINKEKDTTNILFMGDFSKENKNLESYKNNDSKIAVCLIFIDNYDEVIQTIEEIKRPLLLAIIDRKMNALAKQVEGIIKKFEKDKYMFILTEEKLEEMKLKKFEILSQIREIDMGNKVPVTLSIGVGISEKSISTSMEQARAAIDLALGRGGDQVIIKNGEKYDFFGGNSKEIETNARVRARVKAYVLTELIEEASNIIIMGHRNADLDCLGACIGVSVIVESLGKKPNIILNNITSSIQSMYDNLVKINKYKQNYFITSNEALKIVDENTLIIVVDCHKPSIMECYELHNYTKKFVVFDHHRKGAEFIEDLVLSYHEPYASSTCELITEMIQYVKQKINLLPVEADALLAGITLDTKNFVVKTGARTFEAAAYLKRNGADTIRIRMCMRNDIGLYKAKALAINNARIFKDNIAIAYCPNYVENANITVSQTADELLNFTGIEASFALCNDSQNEKILISGRSLGNINVQRILEKMGGGGHQTVAAAQFDNEDLEYIINMLESSINEYMEEVS